MIEAKSDISRQLSLSSCKQLKDTWTATAGGLEKACGSWRERLHYTQQRINLPILSCFCSLHRRHLVHCWNTAKSTLSWVGQLFRPGIHPHNGGTDLSCKQSLNQGQLILILHVGIRWLSMATRKQWAPCKTTCLSSVTTCRSIVFGISYRFSQGNMPKYHFADLLSISGNSAYTLVCCWSVNNLLVFYRTQTGRRAPACEWSVARNCIGVITNLGKKHAERLVRRFWCVFFQKLLTFRNSLASWCASFWSRFAGNTTWVTDEIACLGNLPPPKVGCPLSVMKAFGGCSINIEAEPYNLQGQQVMNFELWSKPFVVPQSSM